MKLYKRDIDKLFIIKWEDARSESFVTVQSFVKNGFAIKESVGWLKYFDKDMLVLASERCETEFDLTMIPYGWITDIKEVK